MAGENVLAVAAEDLRGAFQEEALGRGKNAAERQARVVDAVFAAHQILGDQRPVDPGQHVVVQRVDLAEGRAHLADFELQSGGQRGEGDVALFQIDALLAEGEEEIGAGVGVDDFLEADFAFVHFERRRGASAVIAGGADEIADHADIGVEHLGGRAAGAAQ